jgi:hypothetical protein
MANGIPQDEAAAISIGLEGILYGEYRNGFIRPILTNVGFSGFSLLMFIGTMWALTYKQPLRNINRPIVFVVILLLILSTAVSSSPLTSDVIH